MSGGALTVVADGGILSACCIAHFLRAWMRCWASLSRRWLPSLGSRLAMLRCAWSSASPRWSCASLCTSSVTLSSPIAWAILLPRRQGRVTLNPIAHIDPLGTLLFPALMAMGASVPLAWGKPVEWTGHPANLTRRFSMRTIRFFVAVAGPGMNLLLALLLSAVFLLCSKLAWLAGMKMCLELIAMNFGLLFFNLLPIPPLDGRVFGIPTGLAVGGARHAVSLRSFIFLPLILLGGVGEPAHSR